MPSLGVGGDGCSQRDVVLQCQSSESVISTEQDDSPLPRAGFYYLGVVTLLGWNMILAFTHTFDCNMLGGKTWAGSGWAFWCAMCNSTLVNFVQASFSSRKVAAVIPFAVQLSVGCVLLAISLLGLVFLKVTSTSNDDETVNSTFQMALGLVCIQGTSSALLSSAVFALAGSIDKKLTMDAMIGQGLGGCFAALVGFVAGDSELGLAASFALSAIFGLAGIPVYLCWVKKNHHVRVREAPSTRTSTEGLRPSNSSPGLIRRDSSLRILQRAAWPQCVTVCFVFIVTFVVFPGVTSRWRGNHVSMLIATFQLFDVVGRFAPHLEFFHVRNGPLVSFFSFLRALFVPAFIIVERSSAPFATSIAVQFSIMVSFAFTNGYVSTLSMMLGPGQPGIDVDEAAPVGSMMSFFLVLGIFIGSVLALLNSIGMSTAVSSC